MKKKRFATILIIVATIILAGVAIFTAYRLYQLRTESVAPNAPTSKPEAAAPQIEACTALSFTITATSPTESPTASPTESPTASPTGTATASPTGTATATASPTSGATATPASGDGTTASSSPELPEAGISSPTVIGAGIGIILIIGSLLLVF